MHCSLRPAQVLKPFCGVQIKQGARFVSDTDTEVIPKLCEYIYRNLQEPLPLNEVRWCLDSSLAARLRAPGLTLNVHAQHVQHVCMRGRSW